MDRKQLAPPLLLLLLLTRAESRAASAHTAQVSPPMTSLGMGGSVPSKESPL